MKPGGFKINLLKVEISERATSGQPEVSLDFTMRL